MNKKGVELSMNLIIIAAIGLLVLVILAVLVINATGKTNTTISKSCNLVGGACKQGGCGTDPVIPPTTGQCDPGYSCCKLFTATG